MAFEPLSGVRVLDLTTVIVGPACTWRLGQYGAEVIKVESPEGDLMRGLGGASPTGQHSGAYLHLNRGKRNICLDLKAPGASAIMERLIASAQVIVTNMRPQALAKLGLDGESVRAVHPDKIYCLISGYGSDGPYAGLPTYDSVVQGASGIAGLTLARDGVPTYVPMLICDHVVGEIAAGTIMAALLQQARTGVGCTIEVPMFETMAAFVQQEHLAQASFDPPVGPPGDRRLLSRDYRPVRTADGWMALTVNTDAQVRAFLNATDRGGLVDDPRFASVAARAKNTVEWLAIRGGALEQKTTREWLEVFRQADIAAMPCHTLESLRSDPHLEAVGLVGMESHPTEGTTAAIRSTMSFDRAYLPIRSPSQPKGWETVCILTELGYSPGDIVRLCAQGAVQHPAAKAPTAL
jgi:crotonobetainyl-CoA:carnitine CoA-transferase CaiB-like acyl-CoA transferase